MTGSSFKNDLFVRMLRRIKTTKQSESNENHGREKGVCKAEYENAWVSIS